jgi:hypothetical protein
MELEISFIEGLSKLVSFCLIFVMTFLLFSTNLLQLYVKSAGSPRSFRKANLQAAVLIHGKSKFFVENFRQTFQSGNCFFANLFNIKSTKNNFRF